MPQERRRPPQHLTNRELWRAPTSGWDHKRIERARKEARQLFERSRQILDKDLEREFPGIAQSRAVIQSAVLPIDGAANVQLNELLIISSLCQYLKPKLIFEFGTFNGLTTLHLAMNSSDTARVFTIDLAPDDPKRHLSDDYEYYAKNKVLGEIFLPALERAKITQIQCDTATFDHSVYKGKMNLIFVDAGHEYELVRSDSEKALEMLAPGGVILWHDYFFSHYGVYTWLNELSTSLGLFSIPNTTLVYYRDLNLDAKQDVSARDFKVQMLIERANEWERFRASRSYRLINRLYKLRRKFIPSGGLLERFMRYVLDR